MKESKASELSAGDMFKMNKNEGYSLLEGTLKDPSSKTVRLMIKSEWFEVSRGRKVYIKND